MAKANRMCPFCYIRKMFGGKPMKNEEVIKPYENGARKTPLMGWSSWNTFRNNIDQNLIYETAKALKETGLMDAGYTYVNLDDNWHSNLRTEEGFLQGDLVRFSEGIPALVKKINDLGLKVGIYSSNGTYTCEDLPASLGKELTDARTIANWGIEYFKYDFCHNKKVPANAPLIFAIDISKKGSGVTTTYQVSNAIMKGYARRMKDKKLPGGQFVSGMDEGNGSIVFDNIVVDEDGEYILTINIKKHGFYEKYLAIKVNGECGGEIYVPAQHPFNVTARFQVVINLKAGRNTIEMGNPVTDKMVSAAIQYRKMSRCLVQAAKERAERTGEEVKPILFSICEWGFRKPWLWGASAGNMWRTTPDIRPWWAWMKIIYSRNVKLWKYASPGHFNDPDMLEVGNGKLTYDQNMAHFALWCMMSAPLVLGNDIRKITKPVLDIVTNKDLIAIDQDALGKQAKRVRKGTVDVLAKPLADGSTAVCFFNKGGSKARASYDLSKLQKDDYVAAGNFEGYISKIVGDVEIKDTKAKVKIPKNGVVVFRFK